MRTPLFPIVAFCAMLTYAPAAAALDERIEVRSRTVADEDFLRSDPHMGDGVVLTGHLTGPDGEDRLPVVILLHGTEGPRSYAAWNWSRHLNAAGFATLRLDSYTARGLEQVSLSQGSFAQFQQIYDTYRTVEAVDRHPRLDGSRIAVMGFSRGGFAALYGAMERFHYAFGPRRGSIRAYLSFYPPCNVELVGETKVVYAPIRNFHGSEDDWTLATPCRDYIGRLKEIGADAAMSQYPGARHGFDNPRNPSFFTASGAQTSRNCFVREVDFQLVNAATGDRFTWDDACVQYGPSIKYDEAATTAAQAEVIELLNEVFLKE